MASPKSLSKAAHGPGTKTLGRIVNKKRRYSVDDIYYALAMVDVNGGNVYRTATALGVPPQTLKDWVEERKAKPEEFTVGVKEKRGDLAAKLEDKVHSIVESITPEDIKRATLSQRFVSMGIGLDHVRKLRTQGLDPDPDAELCRLLDIPKGMLPEFIDFSKEVIDLAPEPVQVGTTTEGRPLFLHAGQLFTMSADNQLEPFAPPSPAYSSPVHEPSAAPQIQQLLESPDFHKVDLSNFPVSEALAQAVLDFTKLHAPHGLTSIPTDPSTGSFRCSCGATLNPTDFAPQVHPPLGNPCIDGLCLLLSCSRCGPDLIADGVLKPELSLAVEHQLIHEHAASHGLIDHSHCSCGAEFHPDLLYHRTHATLEMLKDDAKRADFSRIKANRPTFIIFQHFIDIHRYHDSFTQTSTGFSCGSCNALMDFPKAQQTLEGQQGSGVEAKEDNELLEKLADDDLSN